MSMAALPPERMIWCRRLATAQCVGADQYRIANVLIARCQLSRHGMRVSVCVCVRQNCSCHGKLAQGIGVGSQRMLPETPSTLLARAAQLPFSAPVRLGEGLLLGRLLGRAAASRAIGYSTVDALA